MPLPSYVPELLFIPIWAVQTELVIVNCYTLPPEAVARCIKRTPSLCTLNLAHGIELKPSLIDAAALENHHERKESSS